MEQFEVEGTTLLNWRIRIQAHNEGEAREEAQRIAGWIDIPSSLATLEAAQHRILSSRPTDPGKGQAGGF